MLRRLGWTIGCLCLVSGVAQAQFYDLEGAYRCVTTPDAACTARLGDRPPPPPPVANEALDGPTAAANVADAIVRLKQGKATGADIRLIAARADAKDPHAVEALAWCRLNGIGMAPDAVGAYWLYREAADLGVANARKNQIAIFETRLNSAERQTVLLRENDPGREQ